MCVVRHCGPYALKMRNSETSARRLSRWVDSNYQFYGSYYGRHHTQWERNADPKVPAYNTEDFRREATFEEAISPIAPKWHR